MRQSRWLISAVVHHALACVLLVYGVAQVGALIPSCHINALSVVVFIQVCVDMRQLDAWLTLDSFAIFLSEVMSRLGVKHSVRGCG